jgi:hypothetical protein
MLLGSGEGLEEGDEYDDVDFPALLQENKGNVVELCKLSFTTQSSQSRNLRMNPCSHFISWHSLIASGMEY